MLCKLEYVSVFHPRPLASGGHVGKRKEVPVIITFEKDSDWEAVFFAREKVNGNPKYRQTPWHSNEGGKLTEINSRGEEIRVIREQIAPRSIPYGA